MNCLFQFARRLQGRCEGSSVLDLLQVRTVHHHHFSQRPAGNTALIGPAATLGRHPGRFGGTGKSPFRVVVPSSNPTATPPVCSTPQQNSLPLLDSLDTRERTMPEFSTFGNNGYSVHQNLPKPRNEAIEPSGHLV